jgi:hypothetical protein
MLKRVGDRALYEIVLVKLIVHISLIYWAI